MSVKTIHVKLTKPPPLNAITPTHTCLTDRSALIRSPSFTTHFTDKKPNSMELTKFDKGKKKCIRVKKKAESVDFVNKKLHDQKGMLQSSNSTSSISRLGSAKQVGKKTSNLSVKEDKNVNFFDETASLLDMSNNQTACRDWDSVIEEKKKELYSYLYKLDKKVLSFERELERNRGCENNKKDVMELIRKKCSKNQPPKEEKKEAEAILNRYKVNRMRI